MRHFTRRCLLVCSLTLVGLGWAESKPRVGKKPAQPVAAQLRVRNVGDAAIKNLVVLSPGGEVKIGTLAPHAISTYHVSPRGVYPYAAYRFIYQGRVEIQPVKDFVGERPMWGNAFTDNVRFVMRTTYQHQLYPCIELIKVTRNK